MQTSSKGIELIKRHEGLRLTAYQCPAGIWTIGYGHTRDVEPEQRITAEQAAALLKIDLKEYERAVTDNVHIPLSQLQFDALVSFCFNVGVVYFRESTMLKRINEEKHEEAMIALKWWDKAAGKPLKGLKRRRNEEVEMYLKGLKGY